MSVVTRHRVSCGIFGAPKQMLTSVLPTYTDVIKLYNLTKYEMKHEMNQKDPSHFAIATNVSKQIEFYGRKRPFQFLASAFFTSKFAGAYVKQFVCSTLNCRNLSLFGASFFLAFLPDLKICRYFS